MGIDHSRRPPAARKRSTKRRQDAPDLPRRRVEKRTLGRSSPGGFDRPCSSRSPVTAMGRCAMTAGPLTPRDTTTDGLLGTLCTSRLLWTGGGRTFGAAWAGTFSTSRPLSRRSGWLRTCTRLFVGRFRMRCCGRSPRLPITRCGGRRMTSCGPFGNRLPTWDGGQFVEPDTREPLTSWAEAVDQVDEPAHVATFGRQVHSKGILGGSEEAGRHIGT